MIKPTALIAALGQPEPPGKIWQAAFDYVPDQFERLCDAARRPANGDVIAYLNDYRYCEVQRDLLLFLLPRIFFAWGEELLDEAQDYWLSSDCLASFAAKPLYPQYLNESQYRALADYVGEIIRLRMGAEHTLRHSGPRRTTYKWFCALGSYGVVFPYLEQFWTAWWSFEKEADALCAVQYLSCLMYWDSANPCFEPWNSQQGGGPPNLFETDGNIFEQATRPENTHFLQTTLTLDYVKRHLMAAEVVVFDPVNKKIVRKMLQEFGTQQTLLIQRLEALPKLLAKPKQDVLGWEVG